MEVRAESPIRWDEKRKLWIGEIWCGYSPSGKPIRPRVTSKDKNECIRKRRAKVKALQDGTILPGKTDTVGAWAQYWVKEIAPAEVDVKTLRTYESCIRRHIVPKLGARRLDKLTPDDVRLMHKQMEHDDGLGDRSVQAAHKLLKQILSKAVKEGKLGKNPLDAMDTPRVRRKETRSLSRVEASAVIRKAVELDQGLATRWIAALLLGCRQNELLGMTWDCVDFDAGVMVVEKQLKEMKMRHGCGTEVNGSWPCGMKRAASCKQVEFDVHKHIAFTPVDGVLALTRVKTDAGRRVIPIPQVLLEGLRWHKENTAQWNEWGLVWVNLNGKPIRAGADSRAWKALLEAAGVNPTKLHSARHTMVSLLLDANVPLDLLTPFVGHSSVATTRIYAHASSDAMRVALDRLGGELKGLGA